MKEKYLKNSIISAILIVSTILMPLSFIPRKTEAANISSYLGGLSQVITQMPLCQSIGSIKELFSQGSDLEAQALQDLAPTTPKEAPADDETLPDKVNSASNESTAVPTTNATLEKDSADIKASTTATNKYIAKLSNNDTCLKSIGRAVIKMLLQKITTDTVSWINGGMDEDPKFVQNPGDYFKDIAKNEILGFAGEINDPTKFPFGKDFLQSEAQSFNSKFADNAQYSLNKMIQDTSPGSMFTDQTFSHDFSQGGWSAWDAMTQNPANNPLGFSLMASNELAKRIEDKTNLAKDSLQQSGGYLGVQKCVDPADVTKQEDEKGREERATSPTGPYQDRICKSNKWNFVTPGQMVAAAATQAIGYPESNLLKADDLNDAVAAILDSLLSHFSSSFMSENGFAGLSDTTEFKQGSEGNFVINTDNMNNYGSPRVGQDFSDFQVGASSFLAENPNFNIRTDLNQALIDEQRIFRNKLIEENKELKSTIPSDDPTGSFTGNYGIIPTIYQLDYCIPGPHPGFEEDSRTALSAALGTIVPENIDTVQNADPEALLGIVKDTAGVAAAAVGMAIGASIGSGFFGVGAIVGALVGAILGYVVGFIVNLFGKDYDHNLRLYYAGQMYNLTGVKVATETGGQYEEAPKKVAALHDYEPFVNSLNTILDRYIKIIYDVFDPNKMPTVTKEAAGKFLELKGYNQMFTNNEARIISMKSIVERLTEIKNEIDELNNELSTVNSDGTIGDIKDANGSRAPLDDVVDADGNITTMGQKSQYEENLKPWISAFGRISQEMVTGDDIATVDNTIKQIIDEKDYVYNDLLKGPNGCEKDLELMRGVNGPGLPKQVYATKRMSYPGPILYDYNNFGNGAVLPDPYKSGYENKMIAASLAPVNLVGPGFLSYVNFENNKSQSEGGDYCGVYYKSQHIENSAKPGALHSPLCYQDLFELRDLPSASIGRSGGDSNQTGVFETMIGVW